LADKFRTLPERAQRLILQLYDSNKEVVKTSLLPVIPNSYSLERYLRELQKDGLINIREEKIVRKTFYVSLTPKGRAVAEQIRRISEVGQRKAMDLPDSFKLITYLYEHGSKDVASIKEKFPGLFGFVEDMTSSGIIVSRIDSSRYPPESVIDLTEKGKKLAEKIKEIEEILRR